LIFYDCALGKIRLMWTIESIVTYSFRLFAVFRRKSRSKFDVLGSSGRSEAKSSTKWQEIPVQSVKMKGAHHPLQDTGFYSQSLDPLSHIGRLPRKR